MYWNEQNSTPSSSSGSSEGCFTPPAPAFDLLPSRSDNKSWPMQSTSTQAMLQSVLKARKTRKTISGGLERYQPDHSRETLMLGRFPLRNRFISDYIFDKTGRRRTPKQVGSRLQQLRESCASGQLLQLLSPLRKPPSSTSFASTESALSSPTLPVGDELFPNKSSSRHTVMYIDILPERSPDTIHNKSSCSAWSDTGDVIRASEYPRRLGSINPTICFTSRSRIVARARFTVYSEDLILHTETVPLLLLVGHSSETSGFYCIVPDPTRFTISQEVVKDSDLTILFSATYKFAIPGHDITRGRICPPAISRRTIG
ncbi:hypothetical protein B0H13DRAFT_2320024 [Mycena leptocephala]|nr:hypothetical protein B0H13DRAFT_2320024 [Mycena leptocephala]